MVPTRSGKRRIAAIPTRFGAEGNAEGSPAFYAPDGSTGIGGPARQTRRPLKPLWRTRICRFRWRKRRRGKKKIKLAPPVRGDFAGFRESDRKTPREKFGTGFGSRSRFASRAGGDRFRRRCTPAGALRERPSPNTGFIHPGCVLQAELLAAILWHDAELYA